MKLREMCYPCLADFIRKIAGYATSDENIRKQAIAEADEILKRGFSYDDISIGVAARIFDRIKKVTGNDDPYYKVKLQEIAAGRELFHEIRANYNHDFKGLLKLSVVGNSLDFFRPLDIVREDMRRDVDFYIDNSDSLNEKVKNARKILYLADNAGETFFDMPLLQWMRRFAKVIYVVKAAPIQNDVTLEDVKLAGLGNEVGDIMTTGTVTAGILLSEASKEFMEQYYEADFVFAKGMGNYEAISEWSPEGKIFLCFKAKCQPVADSVGVPLNSYVAKLH